MSIFNKIRLFVLCVLSCIAVPGNNIYASEDGPAKEYAIRSAQMAKDAYQYTQFAYFLKDNKSITLNVKSAISMISSSLNAIDSAIYFGTKDSADLFGIDFAKMSRQYNMQAKIVLIKALMVDDAETRRLYYKKAVFLCGNATVEAYTASLYLNGGTTTNTAPPPVVNKKPLSKLEVDKALFLVLDDDLKRQETKILREIEDLKQKLESTTDPGEKTKIKLQIKELETKLAEIQAKRQEIQKKYADIVELIRQEKGEVVATTETTPPVEVKPKPSLPTPTFETSNDAWGESIILDQPLPPGLFYKVQIGVYKTKIDPNIFQGITPITGETTPNGTRYAAGMFTKLADAKEAKDYIKGLGYNDAFVSAYYNNKKISIAEATKLEK